MLTRRRAIARVGAAALCVAGAGAWAQEAGGPAAAAAGAIETVIASQIDAFLRDDFEGAFAFASPNIRRVFGSSERFGAMVRQGYPMVWRPRGWRFAELAPARGRLRQAVVFEDAGGAVHVADYYMVETEDGWRIDGVTLRPKVGAGA
ncbi:MAG: DUF4864 domain-containing protein [Pseudomonadota bacterium]